MDLFRLKLGYALGIFAGSGTNTPALQVAMAAVGNSDRAVGYSATYPFGVAGPILVMYLVLSLLKPKIELPIGAALEFLEIAVRNPEFFGKRLGDVLPMLPSETDVVAFREEHQNKCPHPDLILDEDDVVMITAASYISIGLGMALGLLVGLIPLPIPGLGKLTLGFAGLLLTALVLGYLRRSGSLHSTMPISANLVLRNLGLTIFLA
jgi:uncharacterized transporter YbjL